MQVYCSFNIFNAFQNCIFRIRVFDFLNITDKGPSRNGFH